jgi:hypothetical protein
VCHGLVVGMDVSGMDVSGNVHTVGSLDKGGVAIGGFE